VLRVQSGAARSSRSLFSRVRREAGRPPRRARPHIKLERAGVFARVGRLFSPDKLVGRLFQAGTCACVFLRSAATAAALERRLLVFAEAPGCRVKSLSTARSPLGKQRPAPI
jgi:hypothetical protein